MPGPGELLGDGVAQLFGSALDQLYKSVWNGSQALMRGSFTLADQFTTFSLSDGGGGVAAGSPLTPVWPTMRWLAVAVAVGLFFAQLAMTAVRGGRGLFRSVSGPLQFALAMALTVGGVGALLAATDGLTTFLLQSGLNSGNFVGVLDAPAVASRIGRTPDLSDVTQEDVRATVLAFAALFGFIPASLSFALQMIFRQAAVLVLVATSPVTAAGLLSDATSAWFWRALRWMIAAALIKPTLALILVIGINMLSSTTGVAGLIAGAAVLLISVFAPLTLYRLMAFVDPSTGHGQAVRAPSLRQDREPSRDGGASEAMNTARFADTTGDGRTGSAGATGGGGAAGTGAAAAGPAAGAVAIAGLVRQAAKAGNAWANNQMTGFAVGHPDGARPGSGRSGGRSVAGGSAGSSDTDGTDIGGGPPDEPPESRGGAVGAPPDSASPPSTRDDRDGDDRRDDDWGEWEQRFQDADPVNRPDRSGSPQPPSPDPGHRRRPPERPAAGSEEPTDGGNRDG